MAGNMKGGVRWWYQETYPDDCIYYDMNPEATWENLWECLKNGGDVYDWLGVGDSVVRERCFAELARRLGVDYSVVYDEWMNH